MKLEQMDIYKLMQIKRADSINSMKQVTINGIEEFLNLVKQHKAD